MFWSPSNLKMLYTLQYSYIKLLKRAFKLQKGKGINSANETF
jgi:hypothetical protein